MKHKNISYRSSTLLNHFHQKGEFFFTIKEAAEALKPGSERATVELLSDMVRRGLLMRIKGGLYHIIPYESDSKTYFPNWHLVASYLAGERDYHIGYYSALQIYELTTQPFNVEQIVVSQQMRPGKLKVRNVEFQFIYHNKKHFFGYQKTWIDDFHKLPVSSLEKTIIDCLYKPGYAGGIVEIAKAIFKARNELNYDRLLDYTIQFGVQSVKKRLGFLLDAFEINPVFVEELLPTLSNSYARLDPSLPQNGKFISKWKLQINQDLETIVASIKT